MIRPEQLRQTVSQDKRVRVRVRVRENTFIHKHVFPVIQLHVYSRASRRLKEKGESDSVLLTPGGSNMEVACPGGHVTVIHDHTCSRSCFLFHNIGGSAGS